MALVFRSVTSVIVSRHKIVLCLHAADRAKEIKTTAKVNQNLTDKLISDLQAENARLMEMLKLKKGGVDPNMQGPSSEQFWGFGFSCKGLWRIKPPTPKVSADCLLLGSKVSISN